MTIRNGDVCGGSPRTMNVTFMCDHKVKHPMSIDVDESPSCMFNIVLKAADTCPIGSSDNPVSTLFGGGAIFIIVLVAIVIVYRVDGLSWKQFKQGHHGLETIPHREFWVTVPALIVAGCRFSLSKVVCRTSNSDYQSV